MKFPIKDFLSTCDQIRRKLRISSHLLKKSLMENFIFSAVVVYVNKVYFLNFWSCPLPVNPTICVLSQNHVNKSASFEWQYGIDFLQTALWHKVA